MKGLSWDHPRLWGGRPGLGPVGCVSWAEPLLFSAWNRGEVPPRGAQVPGHPRLAAYVPSLLVGAGECSPLSPACLCVTVNTVWIQSKLALINQPPDYSLEEPVERTVLPKGGEWGLN